MVKEILTTHDVAKWCNIDRKTVVNWIEDGDLKAYRTKGGHRRVRRDDLFEFLMDHKMPVPSHKRILLVDDDEAVRTAFTELFEAQGFEVDTAAEGFEAGVLIQAKKPAIVILDLIMPGMDGFYVCEFIRKQKSLKHTRIIVLTGYPSRENFEKAKKSGANKCIGKPVDNETLLTEVQELIGSHSN